MALPRNPVSSSLPGVLPLVQDAEVTLGLAVAEGLETALSVIRAGFPCWACIDAGNLAVLPVLPGIEALTILVDHDKPNPKTGKRTGPAAAERCAGRWAAAGVEVRTWLSANEGEDFNDLATGRRGAA